MRKKVIIALGLSWLVAETVVVARRRGSLFQLNSIVQCQSGHLFTTIWIPGASFKSLRLGWWRLQRCPVGHHWSLVTPVRESELTEEEKASAALALDVRIP